MSTTTETKPISKAEEKRQEKTRCLDKLREWLPPGSTVYSILKHVSRSGMQRRIDLCISLDGQIVNISYYVARACDMKIHRDGGIVANGCGMDMGFHLVYHLSSVLWRDNFTCCGKCDDKSYRTRCPSNDHNNGDRNYSPHKHSDGGYALRHEWL